MHILVIPPAYKHTAPSLGGLMTEERRRGFRRDRKSLVRHFSLYKYTYTAISTDGYHSANTEMKFSSPETPVVLKLISSL